MTNKNSAVISPLKLYRWQIPSNVTLVSVDLVCGVDVKMPNNGLRFMFNRDVKF